jgi:hypothetical protein
MDIQDAYKFFPLGKISKISLRRMCSDLDYLFLFCPSVVAPLAT